MKEIKNEVFDGERALYGSDGVALKECRFDGPADGESALKESRNIRVKDCYFNLRYPFWHDENLEITASEMTELCRAALWYSGNIKIGDTKLHGIKALRECRNVTMQNCDVVSPEFGWSVKNIKMENCTAESEYFMMRSEELAFHNVKLKGKYSFQYIENAVFENCEFDTKDAFWHGKNVTVRNSIVKGEYLAWYSENITFENCKIIGTQPLCYCKGLRLKDCEMIDTDLSFEKSDVEAEVFASGSVSIKNPRSGHIYIEGDSVEVIRDEEGANGEVRGRKPGVNR